MMRRHVASSREENSVTTEPLNVETLARAIHADELAAVEAAGLPFGKCGTALAMPFDELHPRWKACRREQARLLLNRWMR